jgi:hypothetical protein
MANVIWRYQPRQCRTSYSSNPTCSLASSMASSTRPSAASRSHNLFQAHRLRRKDEVVGDLGGIRQAAPGEQPLLPPRLGPAKVQGLPGPIREARPLTAFPCRYALPPRGLPPGHDLIGAVSEPDTLVLWHGQHVGLQALFQPTTQLRVSTIDRIASFTPWAKARSSMCLARAGLGIVLRRSLGTPASWHRAESFSQSACRYSSRSSNTAP